MAATRADILISLLHQLNHFDERVGCLLRANRHHVVVSAEHVAHSHAQMERSAERARRQARDDRSYVTQAARR